MIRTERERAERTNDNEFLSKDQREQNQQQKSQLQQAITDLESKPNKTPQEEADLIKKRKDLEKLNNQNSEPANDKNNWLKPVLIIGGTALVIGLIIYLLKRNSKR